MLKSKILFELHEDPLSSFLEEQFTTEQGYRILQEILKEDPWVAYPNERFYRKYCTIDYYYPEELDDELYEILGDTPGEIVIPTGIFNGLLLRRQGKLNFREAAWKNVISDIRDLFPDDPYLANQTFYDLILGKRPDTAGLNDDIELETLEVFLEKGVDPNRFWYEKTHLMKLFEHSLPDPETLEIFLKHGADPNITTGSRIEMILPTDKNVLTMMVDRMSFYDMHESKNQLEYREVFGMLSKKATYETLRNLLEYFEENAQHSGKFFFRGLILNAIAGKVIAQTA